MRLGSCCVLIGSRSAQTHCLSKQRRDSKAAIGTELIEHFPDLPTTPSGNQLLPQPRIEADSKKGAGKIPEVDDMRYAPQVKVPVLILNGRFDPIFNYDEHQLFFFERLGSTDKHLEEFPAGHLPPVDKSVSFADKWLGDHTKRQEQASSDPVEE